MRLLKEIRFKEKIVLLVEAISLQEDARREGPGRIAEIE
jgi:hypothetical protein